MATRVALVTGGNKGIGFEICKILGKSSGVQVVFTSRNKERGDRAVEALKKFGVSADVELLDLEEKKSIESCAARVKSKYGGIDMLVNNAAIAFKAADPTPFDKQARPTMKVNYFGTVDVCNAMTPLLRKGGSCVLVASRSGTSALSKMSKGAREKLVNPSDFKDLDALANSFVADVEAKRHKENGWASSCYGTSKAVVIIYARLLAKKLASRDIIVNSCCPGWCKTDMSSHSGPRTAAQGAETPAWLALLTGSNRPSGDMFADNKKIF